MNPEHCVALVLGQNDKPVGEAIIAGTDLIVTCAHVVNTALKRDQRDPSDPGRVPIMVRFPFSGRPNAKIDRRFTLESWLPDDAETFEERDAAALRLGEPLPQNTLVPTLVPAEYERGAVQLYGPTAMPAGGTRPGFVAGEVQGRVDRARYQVDQHLQGVFRAQRGFSGGPVWDTVTGQVVGMTQAIPTADAAVDVYVLGAELLEEASAGELYQLRPSPYVGLRAFEPEDSERFFGRKLFVDDLADAARTDNTLIVAGPSGFGKSSVVLAGLVPRLTAEESLAVGICRLSDVPIPDLLAALARAGGQRTPIPLAITDAWERRLNDEGLAVCAAHVCNATGKDRLLLVIDQFERIFTECKDLDVRGRFLSLLDDLVGRPLGRIQVVLTVRSDFVDEFTGLDSPLGGHFRTGIRWLPPMLDADLREAITEPVRAVQGPTPVEFESGLVDKICEDFKGRPSELPLLQFTLTRLWERQVRHRLTFAAYSERGGVANTLAGYADECLKKLGKANEEAARRVFTSLVVPDQYDVGRQAKRYDLRDSDWPVVEKLRDARLVAITRSETSGEEIVEVAHEALLRKWDQLRRWLLADSEFRDWRAVTVVTRDTWVKNSHDSSLLLRGALLAQALRMREMYPDDITGLARYLEKSEAAAVREEQERQRTLDRAEAVRLAGHSEHAIFAPWRLPLALALGIQALRRQQIFEADTAVRRALMLAGRQRKRFKHDGAVHSVVFNDHSSLLATASTDGLCLVWDVNQESDVARLPHPTPVTGVAFAPDGHLLATAGVDGVVRVWDFRAEIIIDELRHDQESPVAALAFGRDGRLATASYDKTARIWEPGSGRPAKRLPHDGWVTAVAFSPSGSHVVSASYDGEARVWAAETGELVRSHGHHGPVRDIVFNRAGTLLATACDDGTTRIFDFRNGFETLRLAHQDRVTSVAFSPDGSHLACASEDRTARVWSVERGYEVAHLTHRGQVDSVRFGANGLLLATASRDRTARVWDVVTGDEVARLVHEDRVHDVAFSADGALIATASEDGTARLWDVNAGADSLRFRHGEPISVVAFSRTGTWVATAGGSSSSSPDDESADSTVTLARTVRIWNALTGASPLPPLEHPKGVHHVAFGGQLLATACDDNHARLWSLDDGKLLHEFPHDGPVRSVDFDPEAKLLVTASNDKTARIWNVDTRAQVALLRHDDWVGAAVFSPDGSLMATAADNKAAYLWKVSDCLAGAGNPRATVLRHESAVFEVIFDHVGKHVATSANDGNTRIWEAETGELRQTLRHGSRGTAVFSPDGSHVATSGDDGTARIWRVDSGEQVVQLVHEPAVRSVAFSPDGSRLATAGEDGTARIWCVKEGTELARLTHGGEELTAQFNPNGHHLLTAGEDGTARVWLLSPDDLIDQALARLTRNLTEAEWTRYLPHADFELLRHDLGPAPAGRPQRQDV
jgi:WD40 repeat protein